MAQDLGTWGGPYYPFWPYYGYANLGPTQVPPDAIYVGMTDRSTGAVWYLAFDPCNGGRICLVGESYLSVTKVLVTRVYGPYDGPFIMNEGLRLGVRDGHLVFDILPGNSGSPPWAFDLSGNHFLFNFLVPVSQDNPNTWDHLAYDGSPSLFCALTDRDTGTRWFVTLDHDTDRIKLMTGLGNQHSQIRPWVKLYTDPFDGPAIDESGVILGVRGGHLLFDEEARDKVLFSTMAFDSYGAVNRAAQFYVQTLDGQAGVADQLPDHLSYAVIDPVIDECSTAEAVDDCDFTFIGDDDEFFIRTDDGRNYISPDG